MLAFDLQGFETVNLTLGREVGDAILREVPDRVATLEAGLSAVARLGGGTFCVACPSADRETVRTVAGRLRALISAPFDVKGVSALVECRIGIALGGGAELADLLDRAESALDMARQTAGGDVNFFDAGIRERHQRAQNLERALSLAIDNDELHLVYQPQVNISDGRMIGVEALVRWTHPELGPVSPGEFIPIAENGGFIEPLGRWVLERACHDAASWPAGITVAVNVSPLQFQRTDVVQEVFRSLAVSALDPKRLQIEITESIFAQNQEEICATLRELKKAGVTCALDDFGSGFSSLGYLATLPLDKLKLDRMFVRGIETDASRATIVRSVLALSRGLGLKFLCEGIETREELEVLRGLGCREAQGYYFGRPQSKADVERSFDTMGVAARAA